MKTEQGAQGYDPREDQSFKIGGAVALEVETDLNRLDERIDEAMEAVDEIINQASGAPVRQEES